MAPELKGRHKTDIQTVADFYIHLRDEKLTEPTFKWYRSALALVLRAKKKLPHQFDDGGYPATVVMYVFFKNTTNFINKANTSKSLDIEDCM